MTLHIITVSPLYLHLLEMLQISFDLFIDLLLTFDTILGVLKRALTGENPAADSGVLQPVNIGVQGSMGDDVLTSSFTVDKSDTQTNSTSNFNKKNLITPAHKKREARFILPANAIQILTPQI